MGTKARLKFLNRAARFDADIEFVDVIYSAVLGGDLTSADPGLLFARVDEARHPRLSGQKPSDNNRRHVAGHLRRSVHASYIKDLYEDFSDYLAEVVAVTRRSMKPGAIARDHKVTLDAGDILDCGSWEGVLDLVSASFFDRIERMSNTKRILQLLDRGLDLRLDDELVAGAQPYVELRHLLVHADGEASQQFCDEFPGFKAFPSEVIKVTADTVRAAREAITALVEDIDTKAVAGGWIAPGDMQ